MSQPPGGDTPLDTVEHLWFTWTYNRIGEDGGGYGVRAASKGLENIRGSHYRELKLRLGYVLPRGVDGLTEPTPENLSFLKQEVDGQKYQALLHKRFAGKDGFDRASNFFVQVVYNLPPDFTALDAIKRWKSGFWERRYKESAEKIASDKRLEQTERSVVKQEVEEGQALQEAELRKPEHQGWLPEALRFVIQAFLTVLAQREQREKSAVQGAKQSNSKQPVQQSQKEQRVCIVAEPDQVALLILGLAKSLPAALLEQLTFSTYEGEPEHSTALVVGTKWKTISKDDPLPTVSPTSATGMLLAINCAVPGGRKSPLPPNPSAELFADLAVRNILSGNRQDLDGLLADADQKEEGAADVVSFLLLSDFSTGNVDVAQFTLEHLLFVLKRPGLARKYLPKVEMRRKILAERSNEQVVNALLALAEKANQELANMLVGLGTEMMQAGKAAQEGPPAEAIEWLNFLTAIGRAADRFRNNRPQQPGESPWPLALQEQLQVTANWLWATRAGAEKILGFLSRRTSQFALDAVAEMLLGQPEKFKEAQALLDRIHKVSLGGGDAGAPGQQGRWVVNRVQDEAARRLAGVLASGGQEARIPVLVQLLEIVTPPTSNIHLWHALYEQQPRPTHLSWNARAWLVSRWALISGRFANDDLRAWLRVDWRDVDYLLTMGLPEAWQRQAFQELLATQPVPAGLFPLLAQQGYQDKVPLLARFVAAAAHAPQVTERLLQEASLSPEEAKAFVEAHSEPLLKAAFLPPTFVKLVEGYLAGLNERDAARLLKVGYMPLKALGAYAQQQASGAGAPLLAALEQVGARAGKRAAEVLTDWNKPSGSGSLDVQQVVWFWLNLVEIACLSTGQMSFWLDLLQQVPQPRAEVPITMRLHLLRWWAQALASLKEQAQHEKDAGRQKTLQKRIQQGDEQVLRWLKIGWAHVDAVVESSQSETESRRHIPDEWYSRMLTGVMQRQKEALSPKEVEVLERHGEQRFEPLLQAMLVQPGFQKTALDFWGQVAGSSYARKAYLFFTLLWMAQMDKKLAQQVVEGAKEKLDQREKDVLLTTYLPAFRRPEVAEGFADWLEDAIKKLPVRVGKIAGFLGRGRSGQGDPAASGQPAAQPPQAEPEQGQVSAPAPQEAGAQAANPLLQVAAPGGQPEAQPPAPVSVGTPGNGDGQFARDAQGNGSTDENRFLSAQSQGGMAPPAAPPHGLLGWQAGGAAPPSHLPQPSSLSPGGTAASPYGGMSLPTSGGGAGYGNGPSGAPSSAAPPVYVTPPQARDPRQHTQSVYSNQAGMMRDAPAYVPGRQALEIPARIEVRTPTAPNKFVNDFIKQPKTSQLAYLVAALEDIPKRDHERKWPERIAKALGGSVATEKDLEYALVYVAPALGLDRLDLLAECAKTAAKFELDSLPDHLMAYIYLTVKYAYEYNQPFGVLAGRIKNVLDALNLVQAPSRESEKDWIRRLRMLYIIRTRYTLWPEEDLRNVWTQYMNTYFPASQYPPPPA